MTDIWHVFQVPVWGLNEKHPMKNTLLACCFSHLALVLAGQNIIYVNGSSNGANTGTAWSDAYNDLQDALNQATAGDQVWVATGTYFPDTAADRSKSFPLKKGVWLIGGFEGTETTLAERDPGEFPTLLSGNIGAPLVLTDNSFHILLSNNADSNTVLDGFIIEGAYGIDPNGSIDNPDFFGGGITFRTTLPNTLLNPIIRNCIFRKNTADKGGAASFYLNAGGYVSPRIENCLFVDNNAKTDGGGLYVRGGTPPERVFLLHNLIFEHNVSKWAGGGVLIDQCYGHYLLQQVAFLRDTTVLNFYGGGIGFNPTQATIDIQMDSCLFDSCKSTDGGGFSFFSPVTFNGDAQIGIRNTHFSHNASIFGAGGGLALYNGFNSQMRLTLESSVFISNYSWNGGSGLYLENNQNSDTRLSVTGCLFKDNMKQFSDGGNAALYYRFSADAQGTKTNLLLANTLFEGNDGGFAIIADKAGKTFSRVINCTFFNNGVQSDIAKNWSPEFDGINSYNRMDVYNTAIISETDGLQNIFGNNDPGNPTMTGYDIDYCLLSWPDCLMGGTDHCGQHMLYAIDPAFSNNSLVPQNCSPMVNAGVNSGIDTLDLPVDLAGNPRVIFDTVDIGAYEVLTGCGNVGSYTLESVQQEVETRLVQNPVPADKSVRLWIHSPRNRTIRVHITDLWGRTLIHHDQAVFAGTDLLLIPLGGQLPPGTYFIFITDRGHLHDVHRLFVQNR
ncbi:MAG: choice-of-anchor Q domain-containing protein [Saprospiraceae bacterium]